MPQFTRRDRFEFHFVSLDPDSGGKIDAWFRILATSKFAGKTLLGLTLSETGWASEPGRKGPNPAENPLFTRTTIGERNFGAIAHPQFLVATIVGDTVLQAAASAIDHHFRNFAVLDSAIKRSNFNSWHNREFDDLVFHSFNSVVQSLCIDPTLLPNLEDGTFYLIPHWQLEMKKPELLHRPSLEPGSFWNVNDVLVTNNRMAYSQIMADLRRS